MQQQQQPILLPQQPPSVGVVSTSPVVVSSSPITRFAYKTNPIMNFYNLQIYFPASSALLLWRVAPISLLECSQLRSHRWSSSKLPPLNKSGNHQFSNISPNSSSSGSRASHPHRRKRETPLSLRCPTCKGRHPLRRRRRHSNCQTLQSFSRRNSSSSNIRPRSLLSPLLFSKCAIPPQ